jgi:hypothetical protein
MIRRADAPAHAIGGPSKSAEIQRLQAAAAIKLQVFLGLGRCDQRACLLLNHRAKRGPEHSDPGRLSPDRHPFRVQARLLNCLTRKNKSSRFSLYRLQKASEGASAVQCRSTDLSLITG